MGYRITRAAMHLSVDEVKERMNTEARPWVRHHWWIIYNALVAPRKAEEIALHTGVSATTVHRVISTYNRQGPASMETPGKGGRWHQHLTLPEEKEFLAPFFAQAESGEIATVGQIQRAYEAKVGHEVSKVFSSCLWGAHCLSPGQECSAPTAAPLPHLVYRVEFVDLHHHTEGVY